MEEIAQVHAINTSVGKRKNKKNNFSILSFLIPLKSQ
jgi:hypothetical protein